MPADATLIVQRTVDVNFTSTSGKKENYSWLVRDAKAIRDAIDRALADEG